jgi:hypothetical protein
LRDFGVFSFANIDNTTGELNQLSKLRREYAFAVSNYGNVSSFGNLDL